MARYVELRRHTDNDGDALSEEGVRAALEIGRGLAGGYELLVSTGAQRATQTLACFASMLREPVLGGAVVEAGLRSRVEDRWREAYQRAGGGGAGAHGLDRRADHQGRRRARRRRGRSDAGRAAGVTGSALERAHQLGA